MHYTSLKSGEAFAVAYGKTDLSAHTPIRSASEEPSPTGIREIDYTVVDIGGRDVNGSLRPFFEKRGMKFICVDMEPDPSVDIVVPPAQKLPFDDGSIDLIVSTSCFEHDPCFWMTFKEMTRIIKPDGFIYVNAPTAGPYHCYPGDNWRFYSDAGQALAYWSGIQMSNETIYPVKVVETFNILGCHFRDFVCVWKRVNIEDKEKNITTPPEIINNIGILERTINTYGLKTKKKC